jgi:hypothetical protein
MYLDAAALQASQSSPILSLIRAKEQAQAKLAEAIEKAEKAQQLKLAAEERDRAAVPQCLLVQ